MSNVTIIDYGIGNILSVKRAFEYCGAEVVVTASPELIKNAERLVLPGVGAFADGMTGLRERGLIDVIQTFAQQGRPFLGICLGMQMMLEIGEEFGQHEGLGLIPGKVAKIENTGVDGSSHKIPHIGWNVLTALEGRTTWEGTILEGIGQEDAVYFVHSFTAIPTAEKYRLADSYYNGRVISAVIHSNNLYGCQFHPEKSGLVGLKIINNFLKVLPAGK